MEKSQNKNRKPSRRQKFILESRSMFQKLSLISLRRPLTKREIYAIQARHAIQMENEVVAKREAELDRAIDRMKRNEFTSVIVHEEDDCDLERECVIHIDNRGFNDNPLHT